MTMGNRNSREADNVPEELDMSEVHLLLALCGGVVQGCLEVKQLCHILKEASMIETLILDHNEVFANEEAGRLVGTALTSMSQLRVLHLWDCSLSDESFSHIADGIIQGCPQMEELNIPFNFNLTDASEKTFRSLLIQIPQLKIWALGGCGLNFACVYLMQLEFGERLDTTAR